MNRADMNIEQAILKAMRYLRVKGLLSGAELNGDIGKRRMLRLLKVLGKRDHPVEADLDLLLIMWAQDKTAEIAMFVSDVPVTVYRQGESGKRSSKKHYHRRHRLAKRAHDPFLKSYEWKKLRMQAFKLYGRKCQCCGATPESGAILNVDHIKPRRLFPELSLSISNLQVLCHTCNHGKGNWDMTDWRKKEEA